MRKLRNSRNAKCRGYQNRKKSRMWAVLAGCETSMIPNFKTNTLQRLEANEKKVNAAKRQSKQEGAHVRNSLSLIHSLSYLSTTTTKIEKKRCFIPVPSSRTAASKQRTGFIWDYHADRQSLTWRRRLSDPRSASDASLQRTSLEFKFFFRILTLRININMHLIRICRTLRCGTFRCFHSNIVARMFAEQNEFDSFIGDNSRKIRALCKTFVIHWLS